MPEMPLVNHAALIDIAEQLRHANNLAEALTDLLRPRFEQIEPQIDAFVPENDFWERLDASANALQAQYPEPDARPPLYGVPVGIKDIFHAEGFITRAGTALPPRLFAGDEAAVVSQLKAAGALVIGKTVTTELAYFEPGPTRNPHNLARTPGGSSSGSAAAVAAGLVPLASGTQTVGSVIRPAAYCGIVGYKPSFDRIDTAGMVYYSRSADHTGLFTQDVAGMRLVAALLVNEWRSDVEISERPVLAIPEGPYLEQTSPTGLAAFREQVERLRAAEYDVVSIETLSKIEAIDALHNTMIAAEFAQEHAAWFATYQGLYRPRTAEKLREGQAVSEQALEAARKDQLILRNKLEADLNRHGADLWICPAAPGEAPRGISATGSPKMNLPWTNAGLPTLSIPAGAGPKGLPLGLQVVGRFGDDERLLAWAEALEAALR